ncbi:MAG: GNAT family N-acetyltransferase [Peptoniphilaceae bacterium]|nr:GNAT family N-acetyltransferase [Peptoniphilaceae bacterium]MDY5766711.1 GNAT family N-acetyltransferase [Peptoniphilaceae bacterium]
MKREILTDRLLLRPFRADDAEKMFHGWVTDPEVTRYLTWEPHKNMEETERILGAWLAEYEKEDCYRFGIERREDGRLMGSIDVVDYMDGIPEIGYCSGREFWGNGYMTEACRAFVEFLFSEGYPQIRIQAVQQNIGSNRVIQKAGFRFVKIQEEALSQSKPKKVKINCYTLTREEYVKEKRSF